jgi:hypothetical protein
LMLLLHLFCNHDLISLASVAQKDIKVNTDLLCICFC